MREGAISAPFSVFRRNMGQEDALRRKPEEDLCNKRYIIDSHKISLDRKSKIYIHDMLKKKTKPVH